VFLSSILKVAGIPLQFDKTLETVPEKIPCSVEVSSGSRRSDLDSNSQDAHSRLEFPAGGLLERHLWTITPENILTTLSGHITGSKAQRPEGDLPARNSLTGTEPSETVYRTVVFRVDRGHAIVWECAMLSQIGSWSGPIGGFR
jgi:hypothetical protein